MMDYILDTNICIYIIKKKPEAVFNKFSSLEIGSVGISTITLAELRFGVAKSLYPERNAQALEQFITPLEILDFGEIATHEYGNIRSFLEKQGTVIGSLDMLIAAHAKSLNAILISNNLKEFSRIPDLKLENWI
jgi:tRNA(fMet)-specific endonuclease VapC